MDKETTSQSTTFLALPKLISLGELLSKTWEIYSSRIGTFLGIVAIPALFSVVSGILLTRGFFLVIFGAVLGFIGGLLSIFASIALIYAVPRDVTIPEAYKFAFRKVFSFVWIGILNTLMVLGGTLLIIIPGIVFWAWFIFAGYILVHEDLHGMAAMMRSKAYVRNYWWPVFGRVAFLVFVTIGIAFVVGAIMGTGTLFFNMKAGVTNSDLIGRLFGSLFQMLILPLVIIYTYILYQDLATKKAATLSSQPEEKKGRFITAAIFGIIAIILFFAISAFMNIFLNLMRARSSDIMLPDTMLHGTPSSTTSSSTNSITTGNNKIYGVDRYSVVEHNKCEQATGKKCIFDLCQGVQGGAPNNYNCVSGWKPEY